MKIFDKSNNKIKTNQLFLITVFSGFKEIEDLKETNP